MQKNTFKLSIQLYLIAIFYPLFLHAQNESSLSGTISYQTEQIAGASISIPALQVGTNSDKNGCFELNNLPAGMHIVLVRMIGYQSIRDTIYLQAGQKFVKNYQLQKDPLKLSEFVISGTRNLIPRHESPVLVNTISAKTLNSILSNSVADGLNFSPGLRLENNCQNCGFTQLRMNGLEGAYSQILINSRPVFSALAGVYGLEMIPPNMVERMEVTRGAGSVMYGGNAIAGTLNIITKEPVENTFEAAINQAYILPDTPDRTMSVNGSLVNKKLNKGINYFAFNRNRDAWDANGDGFTEITKIKNTTIGFDAFFKADERSKWKAGLFYIEEFRRGGSDLELLPHQSQLAEQTQHRVLSSNVSYETFSKNMKNKFSAYGALQHIQRNSYYGFGGRIILPGDTLTETDLMALNAYGHSLDLSWVAGTQWIRSMHEKISFLTGVENIQNAVNDLMSGYGRSIEQRTNTTGVYAEITYRPNNHLTMIAGGRYDLLQINGQYYLGDEDFSQSKFIAVPVPRISAMYHWNEYWALRATFAQGYRGPQAFDEDLHVETVGGNARFIRLAEDLKTEKSNSASMSLNYEKAIGKRQASSSLEAFYTQLRNPFILTDLEEISSGVSVLTKRNASGASVGGFNMEANFAFGEKWILQSGATVQFAQYEQEEILWSSDVESVNVTVRTRQILRTPNTYGYAQMTYQPNNNMAIYYSNIYTGSMLVSHMVDPENERIELKETPRFWEHNVKISYNFRRTKTMKYELNIGMHNIFNSFQRDFDLGPQRDSGYVYGPVRPRTFFFGIKMGFGA